MFDGGIWFKGLRGEDHDSGEVDVGDGNRGDSRKAWLVLARPGPALGSAPPRPLPSLSRFHLLEASR